jgi:hypothetical protein
MTATEVPASTSPWLEEQHQPAVGAVDTPWVDEDLLDQLAVQLGGQRADGCPGLPAAPQIHRQYSMPGQLGSQVTLGSGFLPGFHQNSLPLLPSGVSLSASLQQQLQGFGSAPDQAALPNSLSSDNNMLQPAVQPFLMFRPAFGAANGVMAGAAFEARPAGSHKSHSPTSSGGQGADEGGEMYDGQRRGGGKGGINKGALAQKRFRERQKVGRGVGGVTLLVAPHS